MLFGATLEELQERMSSAEFAQWIAYAAEEPFGFEMENWRVGMIASAVVNAIHASAPRPKGSRRPKVLTPADFYPPMKARAPRLTREQAEFIERKRKRGNVRDSNSRLRSGNREVHGRASKG